MKLSRTALLALALQAVGGFSVSHAQPPPRPAVRIDRAIELATESLESRGFDKRVYIASVELEKAAVFEKERFWSIRWSEPLRREGTQEREIGAKVTMSGQLILLLSK